MTLPIHIWERGYRFTSASYVNKYLHDHYETLALPNPTLQARDKSTAFMYYLEHGKSYYSLSSTSPLEIKPLLLFYGLTHLLKAALLTVDPFYPDSTSVLAHGVSTRKKKKQQYLFFQDEVKIQRNGLCTHLSEKLFHVKQLENKKISMGDLMECLPELDKLFYYFRPTKGTTSVTVNGDTLLMPSNISIQDIKESFGDDLEIKWNNNMISIQRYNKHLVFPIRSHSDTDIYIPSKLSYIHFLPHLIIHYLLLYNLSMIARYETEWWGNLIRSSPTHDYPLIQSFLQSTLYSGPSLIFDYLESNQEKNPLLE
ncbi:YaaC family protein [Mangrovibacillus cuniculi]|uniref:YaaC-like Protein n=1 Tax=Mangrovibacillus cuniculi TaxID=2593652 RepID=A0A7S8CDE3_9BACI|nr:YaaC family protein [Mangrovibacillus cuniculi]QPC47941.1 hypothetical protein G8O30_13735 [Mangrovibacillus cuniculi]